MATVSNEKDKTFIVYMTALGIELNIHLFCQAQISLFNIKKVIILFKYIEYTNVFLLNSIIELLKYNNINNYPID